MDRLTYSGTKEAKSDVTIGEALNRLAEYEDLEEQGKLIKLPCTPGQSVWKIKNGKISKCVVSTIKIDESGTWFCNAVYICDISDFGETVFLTREEAEATLKKLERG